MVCLFGLSEKAGLIHINRKDKDIDSKSLEIKIKVYKEQERHRKQAGNSENSL